MTRYSPRNVPEPNEQVSMPERYHTVAEVAAMYRITSRTVRNWIQRGELRALHEDRMISHSPIGAEGI